MQGSGFRRVQGLEFRGGFNRALVSDLLASRLHDASNPNPKPLNLETQTLNPFSLFGCWGPNSI